MKYTIIICGGPRCKENFSDDIIKSAKKVIGDRTHIELERRGCMALCHIGPNVEVVNHETGESVIHNKVTEFDIPKIIGELS